MNDNRLDRLTDHFTLAEFCVTGSKLKNVPPAAYHGRLRALARTLEIIRDELGGYPIRITSGYRSPAVNEAVGGSKTSDHMTGYAADFTHSHYGTEQVFNACLWLKERDMLAFDQLIRYPRHVHISIAPAMRGMAW